MYESVNHPPHYTRYKTEVIDITHYLPFCLGNVIKYVLRAPYKGGVEDVKKAEFYLKYVSDDVGIKMDCGNWASFYNNLANYIDELQADGSETAMVQSRILEKIQDSYKTGYYAFMEDLIHKLATLLEEKQCQ